MSATVHPFRPQKFKPGERVITPDGPGEVFESSNVLEVVSVFLDGKRKARIYNESELKKEQP